MEFDLYQPDGDLLAIAKVKQAFIFWFDKGCRRLLIFGLNGQKV